MTQKNYLFGLIFIAIIVQIVFSACPKKQSILPDQENESITSEKGGEYVPPPPPPAPELKDIFFDFDKHNIRPDAAAVLKEDVQLLRDNPDMMVMIEGYADVRGTPAYNLRLAQRRVDSTKAYLVQLGIDPMRIQTSSGGETEKFGVGTTEEAYQLNRRTHFIIVEHRPTEPEVPIPTSSTNN